MRLTLERDSLGLSYCLLGWSVTMTLAQMRQQIQFLLFRNRHFRAINRNASFGKLFQQAIHRYADDRRKLLDRYIRHLPPPDRARLPFTARHSKTKAPAPS